MPIKVLDLELSADMKPIWGIERYECLHILVRYLGKPVSWVYFNNSTHQPSVSAERLRETIIEQIWNKMGFAVIMDQIDHKEPDNFRLPPISVVVCTRDRTAQLANCLQSLMTIDYPDYEIIIVDNAPSNEKTAQLAVDLPVRYVRENHPGLDWARNRGLSEARHEIIAFTDDDAMPDRYWLRAIASSFAEPDVMAVTGLVVPAELETTAQISFETGYGGMGKGFRRRIFNRKGLTIRELLWSSNFGVGANMAFRRQLFEAIHPFDVALDVGTSSKGGGDIEMFHRILAYGYTLLYEPAAIVWHAHRRSSSSLRMQIYSNGCAFGAYLLTCARNRTVSRLSLMHFSIYEWLGWWIVRRLLRPNGFSRRLILNELMGATLSPFAFRKAQRQAKYLTDSRRDTISL